MADNLIFDRSALIYDRVRPRYTPELFRDVAEYARLGADSRALEIGAGTGQATGAMLETGAEIAALEPGMEMNALLRTKYAGEKLRAVETTFEDWAGGSDYDLIYSATAFHWIPEEIGYPKALRLLKPGGAVALFWNHPAPTEESAEADLAVRAAYGKHGFAIEPKPLTREAIDRRRDALLRYGFADAEARVYCARRSLTAQEHTLWLNTHSGHLALAQDTRLALEADVERAIDAHGGTMTLCDTIDLYMGRRLKN